MTNILLLGNSTDFASRVGQAVPEGFLDVHVDSFPATAQDLIPLLNGSPKPDLALLEPGPELGAGLSLAHALAQDGIGVLLVTDHGPAVGLDALRAGVRDVVDLAAPPVDIRAALDRAVLFQPAPAVGNQGASAPGNSGHRGRIISVASPKGGVGKTTVATNLAVGLAKRAPTSTVLVDADLHFGDVASALNLNPEYALPDMVEGPAASDSLALKSLLTLHETGLYVIPGSESPAAADAVTAASLARLLDTLAGQFQYVVVDTAPGLSEPTLAVLDQTDTLVLVTSLDVPGVRGLRKELETLNTVGLGLGPRHVVLNFFETSRGLSVKDVEATIKTGVDIVLPASKAVPVSVNQGIPLVQSGLRDPVTKQLQQLVDLVGPPVSAASTRRLFGSPRRAKG